MKLVGKGFIPGDVPGLAIDPEPEADTLACRHHARPQYAACAMLEAQQDIGIVFELAAGNQGREIGGKRLHIEAGHEAH